MNKKGFIDQLTIVIVMGIVLTFLVLAFFVWAFAAPYVADASNEINTIVSSADFSSGTPEVANATAASITPINSSIQQLQWISYAMIIVLFIGFVVMCFYVRTYPFLAFIWIAIIIMIVFMSIFLSVSYQDAREDIHTQWANQNYLLEYLPHIITVMGIIGGIIMFVLATRDSEAELGSIPV